MTWLAARALLARLWPAIPMIGLAIALMITRETLADRTATLKAERDSWTAEVKRAEAQRATDEARYAGQQTAALTTYADRLAAREPIILRSTDTVRTYAQTDAGRAACLGADRVRGLDALDAELFPRDPAAAGGSPQAVPSDAGASPARR